MGTNYTATVNETGQELHLGKRSAGWRFVFKSNPGSFTNTRELSGWLESTPAKIENEYGVELNPVEWFLMATGWGCEDGHTTRYTGAGPCGAAGCHYDIEVHGNYCYTPSDAYQDDDGNMWLVREFY